MKQLIGIVLLIGTVVVSLVLLYLGMYPGRLSDMLFSAVLFGFIWLPVVLLVGAVLAVVLWRRGTRWADLPLKHAAIALVLLGCTVGLLVTGLPRQVGFSLSRGAFEAQLAAAPVREYGGAPLNAQLGVFVVKDYAADPRGGTYFRVFRGADGIGPDTMSYGFVYQPNDAGTPFGAARYQVGPLGGEWYWFQASDDF
jgi:hypothetical protein